jgi:hypothetical protein
LNELGGKSSGLEAKIADLETKLATVLQHFGQQHAASEQTEFETSIAALPAGYKEVLGEGTAAEMDRAGEQFKNRVKLYQQVQALKRGMQATGQALPAPKVLFERAVRSLYGVQEQKITRREVAKSLQHDASGRFISRPSGRRRMSDDPGLDPVAKATAAVKEKMSTFGTE